MTEGTPKTLGQNHNLLAPNEDVTRSIDPLSHDILRGANAIAGFLFGNAAQRRKVYHLAETSRLPVFRLGSVLCARRTVLLTWIAEQEQRAVNGKVSPR